MAEMAELLADPLATPSAQLLENDGSPRDGLARRAVGLFPLVVLFGAVTAFSFLSGGYTIARSTPVVFSLAAALLACVWLTRRVAVARRSSIAFALFGAWTLWTGASVLWSVGPDLSWITFNTALLYAIVLIAGGVAPSGPRELRLAAEGYLAVVVAIAVYAYLGKVVPEVVTHAHVYARLDSPVGYWNVLALMLVMAVPIALEAGSRRAHAVWVRALATAGLVVMFLAFYYTFSRGSYVVLALALLFYFIFASERLSSLATFFAACLPVAAVLVKVRLLHTLSSATLDDGLRTAQGHVLGRWSLLVLAVAVLAQVAVALVHRRVSLEPRAARRAGIATVVLLVIVLVAGAQLAFASKGGVIHWVSDRISTAVSGKVAVTEGDSSRLLSLDTGRQSFWDEGFDQIRVHPLLGTGAGTFRFSNYRFRHDTGIIRHAHSQWINALSETGVIGLALFVAAIGALLAGVFRRRFRGRHDPHRALVAAVQAACVAFVVHLTWDWSWDMPAVVVAFLLLATAVSGYLAGRDREATADRDALERSAIDETAAAAAAPSRSGALSASAGAWPLTARVLATCVVAFMAVTWLLPYLADRAESRAVVALASDQFGAAAAASRSAFRFDPLAVDPLITLAQVQTLQGQASAALVTLEKARRLQPQNYRVYYQLGVVQLDAFDRRAAAEQAFRAALVLNPLDALSQAKLLEAQQP
jgi:hypothetical protein